MENKYNIALWKVLDNTQKELIEVITNCTDDFTKLVVKQFKDLYNLDLVDKENSLYYGLGGLYHLDIKEQKNEDK